MKLYHLPKTTAKPPRTFVSCFTPLPRLAPSWHKHCKQCWLHLRNYCIVSAMQREDWR